MSIQNFFNSITSVLVTAGGGNMNVDLLLFAVNGDTYLFLQHSLLFFVQDVESSSLMIYFPCSPFVSFVVSFLLFVTVIGVGVFERRASEYTQNSIR